MEYTRFEWENVDEFALTLLGPGAEQSWHVQSDLGSCKNFSVDSDACSGRMEFFELATGFKALVFDCIWSEPQTYKVREDGSVRFNFSIDIDIDIQLDQERAVTVDQPSWRVMHNPPGKDLMATIPAGRKACWVSIYSHLDEIEAITGLKSENVAEVLAKGFLTQLGEESEEFQALTTNINLIARDIVASNLSGGLRLTYVQARCIELLCLALAQLMKPETPDERIRLTQADLAKIEQVYDRLRREFAEAPTIAQLSKDFGLNRNKLIAGFKQRYDKTISAFLQEQRLEEGKRLLQQTELPIIDVASQVGFNHQSNFATAMKKHFGKTPKQFRG